MKHSSLLLVAACTLALAGCGGGSGGSSDKAVSPSPQPPSASGNANTGTVNPGSGTTTPGTGAAPAPTPPAVTPAPGTTPAPAPAPGTTPAPAPTPAPGVTPAPTPGETPPPAPPAVVDAAPISAAGINGTALLSMLDHKLGAAGPRATPMALPADGRRGAYADDPAMPKITTHIRLEPTNYVEKPSASPYGPVMAYKPLLGASSYELDSYVQGRDGNSNATVAYTELKVKLGLSADQSKLTLAPTLTVTTGPTKPVFALQDDPRDPPVTLTAASAKEIGRKALVAFNMPVQQWNGPNGQFVQLLVLKGQDDDEAESCWNFNLDKVKRLVCHSWDVPKTWNADSQVEIESHGIEDDRSTYAGESGKRFWRECKGRCEADN